MYRKFNYYYYLLGTFNKKKQRLMTSKFKTQNKKKNHILNVIYLKKNKNNKSLYRLCDLIACDTRD